VEKVGELIEGRGKEGIDKGGVYSDGVEKVRHKGGREN
jgi:hypothetical protein